MYKQTVVHPYPAIKKEQSRDTHNNTDKSQKLVK